MGHQRFIASKVVARTGVLERLVHLEFASRAGLRLLLVHGGGKPGFVDLEAALAADIVGEVERETVGIVQLEGDVTRQHFHATGQGSVQNLHADFERLVKTLFLGFQHLHHAIGVFAQVRVGLAHELDQIRDQLVEEGRLLTQLVTVTDRAADDAALHIATAFVAGNDPIGHQERGGAQVVSNHAQRRDTQVGATSFTSSRLDQGVKEVNLVVAVHMLQDGSQALEAHAGVHTGGGQLRHRAVLVHFKLHEHVVPDFNETVAVFLGAARRAAGDVVAVVVENFAAGTARTGVSHHPEVVGFVTSPLVVADADHTLRRQANVLCPDVVSLVIFLVHRGEQSLLGQAVHLREQLPGPLERFAFEVVAKRPVAQHLEEGVVTCGVPHIFQVIVFTASAQTGLHRGSTHIAAAVGAQKHVLELHHARVGEHQSGVITRHQGAGRHHGMPFGRKKVEKTLTDLGNGKGACGHGCLRGWSQTFDYKWGLR